MKRGASIAFVLVLLLLAQAATAGRLRLVIFDAPGCEFCAAWERDVGVIYHKTEEGRRAPLLRAHAFSPPPQCWSLSAPIRYSPTFVLLHDEREVGRIDGYLGEDQFWGLLEVALAEVPALAGEGSAGCRLDSGSADRQ